MSSFNVSSEAARGTTVVRVEGELDIGSAPELRAELDRVVREHDGDVVVDLCPTTFIDSTGLAVLLNAVRRLTRARRGFGVRCTEGPARDVIRRARLEATLRLSD